MTPIEQQALALINEVRVERSQPFDAAIMRSVVSVEEALCRLIERHEAFRREVSDALRSYFGSQVDDVAQGFLGRFIFPEPVDPFDKAFDDAVNSCRSGDSLKDALRQALAARGLEIVEKKP